MRTLRRRILIREYDYKKIYNKASNLYDRVTFDPISIKELEQKHIMDLIKHPRELSPPWHLENPLTILLWHNKLLMYNTHYVDWKVAEENGYITLQVRKNTPVSLLGWATFEKDQ